MAQSAASLFPWEEGCTQDVIDARPHLLAIGISKLTTGQQKWALAQCRILGEYKL